MKFGGEFDRFQYNVLNAWDCRDVRIQRDLHKRRICRLLAWLAEFVFSERAAQYDRGPPCRRFPAFAQDDYHMTSTLTLNVGLRYEGQGAFSKVRKQALELQSHPQQPCDEHSRRNSVSTAANNTLQANHFDLFAPRVGFAWTPSPASGTPQQVPGIFFVPISAQRKLQFYPTRICHYTVAAGHESIESNTDLHASARASSICISTSFQQDAVHPEWAIRELLPGHRATGIHAAVAS